jgi:alkylation response protein AidB-like acyl-CoA dehydrogenase
MVASSTADRGLEADDVAALRATVAGASSRFWPAATSAPDGDLGAVWKVAAGQGWTDFGDPHLLRAAVAVQEELGRRACPLPIIDVALASAVATGAGRQELARGIASGAVRPVMAHRSAEGGIRHVEAAAVATHLLAIDERTATLQWYDLADAAITALPGLAAPGWSSVVPARSPDWRAPLSDHPHLLLLRRLGLASRATAAVRRTHELAVAHAGDRRQFGRQIGAFQAVSHRLVDVEAGLTAASALLEHVLTLHDADDPAWVMAAELYLGHVTSRLPQFQFAGHHTLAAVGYFEEHEAPWLFRRVHADLAVMAATPTTGGVGTAIVDHGAHLPDFGRGPRAEAIRGEVIDAFEPWMSGAPSHLRSWDVSARSVLRDRGWIGVGWPAEVGGGGYPTADVMAFSEALAYVNPPLGNILMGINSIAPMLIKVGPPALRDLVLEEIRGGDLSIALGYSEPEAGSDLASLRTRAERVDGGWRITGQKMWGTSVPDSKWMMLAARTDPEAVPAHAGISLFLVDLDSPGITVVEHRSLGGDISATTFWDEVFVPDERLVGEPHKGWAALSAALAGERVLIGASVMRVHRAFERLVALVRERPEVVVPARRDDLRSEIGRLAVRLQAARALVDAALRAVAAGEGARTEAPMAKILATELAEDLNASAIALLGPDALYAWGTGGAAGDGWFEDGLRSSIMGVVAGGTGDIQRNLVARGMGLPR